jgi:hypothetical protein
MPNFRRIPSRLAFFPGTWCSNIQAHLISRMDCRRPVGARGVGRQNTTLVHATKREGPLRRTAARGIARRESKAGLQTSRPMVGHVAAVADVTTGSVWPKAGGRHLHLDSAQGSDLFRKCWARPYQGESRYGKALGKNPLTFDTCTQTERHCPGLVGTTQPSITRLRCRLPV